MGGALRGKVKRWEFLAGLALTRGWRNGVEIGVSTGRFTIFTCSLIKDFRMTCIDPWTEQAERPGVEGAETYAGWKHEKNYQRFNEVVAEHMPERVRIIRAFSKDAAVLVPDGIDFLFIDGDHTYEGALSDLELYAPKVVSGGLIAGHDINWVPVAQAVTDYAAGTDIKIQLGPDNVFFWVKP